MLVKASYYLNYVKKVLVDWSGHGRSLLFAIV